MKIAIETDSVSVLYRQTQHSRANLPVQTSALSDVSLSVALGEVVALLGPNGAGKSTLLQTISGALKPNSGEIKLFGEPLSRLSRRDIARQIAVVSQAHSVTFGFSVRDVVMMGRSPHQGGWMVATDRDRQAVDDAMRRCDLLALADRLTNELSGGEQKRVTIARALAQEPHLLLLDEPTAFLDVRHAVELHELVLSEVRRGEMACVIAMHDLNMAAQHATRIALMKKGRIVASGSPENVMTAERLRDVFEVEMAVGEVGKTRVFVPTAK